MVQVGCGACLINTAIIYTPRRGNCFWAATSSSRVWHHGDTESVVRLDRKAALSRERALVAVVTSTSRGGSSRLAYEWKEVRLVNLHQQQSNCGWLVSTSRTKIVCDNNSTTLTVTEYISAHSAVWWCEYMENISH